MEPKNDGFQKESPIPAVPFSNSMLNFGRVYQPKHMNPCVSERGWGFMETLWNYVFCPDMAQLDAWLVVFVVDVLWHLHSRIRDDGPVHRPVHGPVLFGSFGKGEGFTCRTQVSNKDLTDSDKKNLFEETNSKCTRLQNKRITESKYPHIYRIYLVTSPSKCFLTWKNISSQYLLTGYHVPPRKLIAPKGGV